MITARRLSDAAIAGMTVEQLNAGLRSYRQDLRYTRADAARAECKRRKYVGFSIMQGETFSRSRCIRKLEVLRHG